MVTIIIPAISAVVISSIANQNKAKPGMHRRGCGGP
jgi:hypothetical protein